jgi:CHAP domain
MTTREATVKCLIDIARSQVGTARRPINNVKYNTAYYGHEVSGQDFKWCVVFIWWCMQKCGVPMSVFPKSASVFAVRDWFKDPRRNRYFAAPTTPLKGDLVTYRYSHIGLVAELLTGGRMLTIEGNQQDAVRKVIHNLNEPEIEGYCRPAYHMVEDDMTKDELLDALKSDKGQEILRQAVTAAVRRELRVATGPDDASVPAGNWFDGVRRDITTIKNNVKQ